MSDDMKTLIKRVKTLEDRETRNVADQNRVNKMVHEAVKRQDKRIKDLEKKAR